MSFLYRISSKINFLIENKLKKLYEKSSVRFIFRSRVGVDTYIHPEKIFDVIRQNSSCDAEQWILSLQSKLDNLDVVVDVGANIGIVSCWLAKRSKKVYSFEPEIDNVNFLEKNIDLNEIENIQVIPAAVGASDGTINFYERESFGHHGTTDKHITKTAKVKKVPSIALDSFCRDYNIDRVSFLKIDVEGAEIDVLRGFETYLKAGKIDMILYEHAPVLLNNEERISVFDYLMNYNYAVFDMQHREIDREDMLSAKQGDFYAKHI